MAEIQRERVARIAGCVCEQHDTSGALVHAPACPLRAPPSSQMALATEALWRARMRSRDAAERYVEHIERAIAEKAARHRVLS